MTTGASYSIVALERQPLSYVLFYYCDTYLLAILGVDLTGSDVADSSVKGGGVIGGGAKHSDVTANPSGDVTANPICNGQS